VSPAIAIIKKRGGEVRVAAIAGAALSVQHRRQQEEFRGGTGGLVPQARRRGLPDCADADGIVLAAEEFLIPCAGAVARTELMRASLENMQRGGCVSECTGSGVDPSARASGWDNQSEDGDALGAPARCLLLRERGTPQDAVRKMKVAESIDIEFLQAERLQDFFAFHRRRPVPKVMNYRATTEGCHTRKLFLWVELQLQKRMQRKINECVHGKRHEGTMQPTNWTPEHSDALRDYLAKGMSYSKAARAINAKFGTAYTRSAAIGRGRRIGLAGPETPKESNRVPRAAGTRRRQDLRVRRTAKTMKAKPVRPRPVIEPAEPVKLRCVGIKPRLLGLLDLEAGDCRYPYGGDKDGEAITFCGHPRRAGSSYCTPHFHLTRGPGIASERAAGPLVLRLVEAA
jgi:GcrA cell cycle regulator